jgi:hypothetical protein
LSLNLLPGRGAVASTFTAMIKNFGQEKLPEIAEVE